MHRSSYFRVCVCVEKVLTVVRGGLNERGLIDDMVAVVLFLALKPCGDDHFGP